MASKFIGDHSGDGSLLSNVDASTLGGLTNSAFAKRADSASNGFWSLDSRAVNDLPADRGRGVYADFKQNSTNGLSDGGTYNGVITFRTYGGPTDLTGGMPHQLGFTENGNVWHRKGSSASAWTGWNKMWHSGNDGSGSGLDADLVDGLHASSFIRSDAADTASGTITFTNPIMANGAVQVPYAGGTKKPMIVLQNATTYGLFHTEGANDDFTFDFAGTAKFTFNQTGNLTAAGDVTAYSDARLKSDVVTFPNALDTVKALRGTAYVKDGKASVGVIAQEVEEVLPQVVHTADDEMGTKSVAYGNMVGVLIEAIKELEAKVAELEEKLNGK